MALMVRVARRPWLLTVTECAGTSFHGRALSWRCRVGVLPLDGEHVVPACGRDRVAVSVWVCIASTVTTAAVRSKHASRSRAAGISLLFAAMATCPSTVPVAWSRAASKCGASCPVCLRFLAPRTVLPSRAITRRPCTTSLRVHSHAPSTWSSRSASSRANSLRRVDSSGAAASPIRTRSSPGRSAAHSPIAANERAPATTAVTATASTPASR
jgi:hypothetical protein